MKRINKLFCALLTGVLAMNANMAGAQNWNFKSTPSDDEANLKADSKNWKYDSTNDRYSNLNALNGALTANGQSLKMTDGLTFEQGEADGLRIDVDKRLILNKKGTITIVGLKEGQVVTVEGTSSHKTTARSITATNLAGTTGFDQKVTMETTLTCTGTVEADGDVTISNPDGGFYLYSINVKDESEVTPPVSSYNDVPLNTAKNQMVLTLGSEVKYYNTDDVKVAFNREAGTVTVTPNAGTWQDVYTKTVNSISFALAKDDTEGGEVSEGDVKIKTYSGWFETAYIEWELLSGASSYNVYVKGGSVGSEYTKIDYQLVRKYKSYGRADVPGLSAGTYSLKVVPVISGNEDESKASSVDGIEVKGHDRTGFAFANGKAPGAYNNDGTLKKNAVVIYVTDENKDDITLDVVTSSKGAVTSCKGLQTILNSIKKGYDSRVFVFRMIGQVSVPADADKGDIVIDMGGKKASPGITFEGIGNDAVADGWGLRVKNASSVEIRNIGFMNCSSDEGDNVGLQQDNEYVWVHNCDMFYGNAGSDADQIKGDGALDCKKSNYITFSYNHFWDNGKACLLGLSGENDKMYITYHHNWFDHSDSRHPRIRSYSAHVYNNYFDGCAKYGVGSTNASSVFVENNYYRNTNRPMMISMQGTDVAFGDGTFSSEDGGIIKSYGNAFAEKSSKFSFITYQQDNVEFDAYEASERNEKVPSSVKTKKGGTTYNNFDTDPSIMYEYTPDPANEVVSVVTGKYGAGRLQHGDFQWSFNNSVDDSSYDVNKELKSAVTNYKTTLVGIFDGSNDESGNQGGGETTEPGGNEGETGETTGGETTGGNEGETGGDEGEGEGTETPVTGDVITCSFGENKSYSNTAFFTISGNTSGTKGTITVDGTAYEYCLKMESSTSIKFTTTEDMTLKLYFGKKDNHNINIDGNKEEAVAEGDHYVLTYSLPAGQHELTKANTANLYLIMLVPAGK